MKLNIYTVYDSKAETYTPPWFQHKEQMAIRTFGDCCNDKGHTFGMHPADYTLFAIGEFDDITGEITQDKIVSITNGLQLQEIK